MLIAIAIAEEDTLCSCYLNDEFDIRWLTYQGGAKAGDNGQGNMDLVDILVVTFLEKEHKNTIFHKSECIHNLLFHLRFQLKWGRSRGFGGMSRTSGVKLQIFLSL